jgi:hypothetical protein
MRVTGSQHVGELVVERSDARLKLADLVGEGRVIDDEFPGRLQVTAGGFELAEGRDDRRQLGETFTHPPCAGRVGMQFRVGKLALQVCVLGQHRVDRVGGCALRQRYLSAFSPVLRLP